MVPLIFRLIFSLEKRPMIAKLGAPPSIPRMLHIISWVTLLMSQKTTHEVTFGKKFLVWHGALVSMVVSSVFLLASSVLLGGSLNAARPASAWACPAARQHKPGNKNLVKQAREAGRGEGLKGGTRWIQH